MAFSLYSTDYVVNPFGSRNKGATCYWNALFQSLISLPSLNKAILDENIPSSDMFLIIYKNTIKKSIDSKVAAEKKDLLSQAAPLAWDRLYEKAKTRKDKIPLTSGQQCAGEGFNLFLDMLDSYQKIKTLFEHRYTRTTMCDECGGIASRNRQIYCMFEIDPNMQMGILEDGKMKMVTEMKLDSFIKNTSEYIDAGFRCTNVVSRPGPSVGADATGAGASVSAVCGDTKPKHRETKLTMISEILVIMAKKYQVIQGKSVKLNVLTPFPERLTFSGRDEDGKTKQFIYEAVAQIEHSGGTGGGHYWAVCKRQDGKWYTLNDQSVSPGKFGATVNTYMVFYHIFDLGLSAASRPSKPPPSI